MELVKKEELKKEIVYSHSRLTLFETCPEAYKIKYIDKTFPDIPKSVELFLGELVHLSLEWLYRRVRLGELPELDETVMHFASEWRSTDLSEIRFNGFDPEIYFNKGVRFIVNYYQRHFPFKDGTIGIEEEVAFPLDEEGKYKMRGFVDRIVFQNGTYEVHDYKTNNYLKTQKQIDEDKQLAFYHIGLKKRFGEDINVKLVWHFLAHDLSISSVRTKEQLEKLKEETIKLIQTIETNNDWWSCGRKWCDWCTYKKNNGLTL